MTAVEIHSRYAFAIPIYRKNTSSITKAVTFLLKQFKDRFGGSPKLAHSAALRHGSTLKNEIFLYLPEI